jgi:hypothetical protein
MLTPKPVRDPLPLFEISTTRAVGLPAPSSAVKAKVVWDSEMLGEPVAGPTAKVTEISCGLLFATGDVTETVAV